MHLAKQPRTKKPLKVKSTKAAIYSKQSAIPSVKFEEQNLTSYSGLVIIQKFFKEIGLKERLNKCVRHLPNTRQYNFTTILFCLIIHSLIGFRKLTDVQYYGDDPMVRRVTALHSYPSASTLSRMLSEYDAKSVEKVQDLNRNICLERIAKESLNRVTLDFDGSVLSTKRHSEGTAVGFNKKKKGLRSYYPLQCTIAQTGQVLDVLHRSGNVHDSNGASELVIRCVEAARENNPDAIIEVRMDSAFFSDYMVKVLEDIGVEYTITVPFERLTTLKTMITERRVWWPMNGRVSFFEKKWKPSSWSKKSRFLFIRQKTAVQGKNPVQLDLFEPKESKFDYKVIITNKKCVSRKAVKFHEGRGYQENIFSELKSQLNMEYIPCRKWNGNKIYLLSNFLVHNLGRELQMSLSSPAKRNNESRSPLWVFEGIGSIRQKLIHRAGRLTNEAGKIVLTMNLNKRFRAAFERLLSCQGG